MPDQSAVLRFGRYRVVQELGRGAMGRVFEAQDDHFHRRVAIKAMTVFDDDVDLAEQRARFRQEALAGQLVRHPNVVAVHELGRDGEWLYLAMELLEGQELGELLARGPLSVPGAVSLAAQVASGLSAAHARGIVHRDIKPSNIMVLPGHQAKIMDFGIAQMRQSEVRTQTGVMLGSPKYMSPEQVQGRRVDHRTDIFSLGSVLYQMLTGRPPFEAPTLISLLQAIARDEPAPPVQHNPAVPAALSAIVAKAMAKRRSERYQNAADLERDLLACLRDTGEVVPTSTSADEATAMRIGEQGSWEKTTILRRRVAAAHDQLGSKRKEWMLWSAVVALIALASVGLLRI